jgi:hypothetical protein
MNTTLSRRLKKIETAVSKNTPESAADIRQIRADLLQKVEAILRGEAPSAEPPAEWVELRKKAALGDAAAVRALELRQQLFAAVDRQCRREDERS